MNINEMPTGGTEPAQEEKKRLSLKKLTQAAAARPGGNEAFPSRENALFDRVKNLITGTFKPTLMEMLEREANSGGVSLVLYKFGAVRNEDFTESFRSRLEGLLKEEISPDLRVEGELDDQEIVLRWD